MVHPKDMLDGIFRMVPGKQSNCDGNPKGDLGVDVRTLFYGL